MAIAINSTVSASVPAAYGASTPVIDFGRSPGLISTAMALARAGSVVLSLSGTPRGSVTYTATGLLHELALANPETLSTVSPGDHGQSPGNLRLSEGFYNASGAFSIANPVSGGAATDSQRDAGSTGNELSETSGTKVSTSA